MMNRALFARLRIVTLFAATFGPAALVPLTASAQGPPTLSGRCAPTSLKYKFKVVGLVTASTSAVNMPDMAISFVQGDSGTSCAVILFSAEAISQDEALYIRALLDGTPCQPDQIKFRVLGDSEARAANFICEGVGPGRHIARMQFWSLLGNQVGAVRASMILQHTK